MAKVYTYLYRIVGKEYNSHGNQEVIMAFSCENRDEKKRSIRYRAVFEKFGELDLYQVVFYQVRDRNSKEGRFQVVPNNVKYPRKVVETVCQMIADLSAREPKASFFWIGAARQEEDHTGQNNFRAQRASEQGTQRHCVWKLMRDKNLSHLEYVHLEDQSRNLTFLVSRASLDKLEEMEEEIYQYLPGEN